jgi:hypothetical protein
MQILDILNVQFQSSQKCLSYYSININFINKLKQYDMNTINHKNNVLFLIQE